MAEDAVEEHTALLAEFLRHLQRIRRLRIHTSAVIAAIHLEPGVQTGAPQRLRGGEVVHHHAQRGARLFRDAPYVGQVRRVERKRPRDIGEPGASEHIRFDERRHRDARGAVRYLALAELHALVRLEVRPQADAELLGALGHVLEVALHHVEVEEQRRGLEVAVKG